MNDLTQLMNAAAQGDSRAADEMLRQIYDELRRLAAQQLAHERPDHTLSPTALVHEAYLRLARDEKQNWEGRRHFFAAAAEAMRRLLVESARSKKRLKRGGDWQRMPIDGIAAPDDAAREDLLGLDEALTLLAKEDPIKARLVELRYFAGLTVEDAAECLGVSRATADRYWAYARAWLFERMKGPEET
jgi:RNA polymerase sigma factor (TIGR02999 family)